MAIYLIGNGAMQTTAAFVPVTTGTAIKTMLQVKASATAPFKINEWGYSFDSAAGSVSAKIELIETDVAATVTAAVAADITKLDAAALAGGDPTTNLIQVGTSATGYTATAEGSITAVRNLDAPQYETISTSYAAKYSKQFPLGREPIVQIAKFARVRVTLTTTAALMYCYMLVEV